MADPLMLRPDAAVSRADEMAGSTDFLTRLALSPEMDPAKLQAVIQAWITISDHQEAREERARKQRAEEAYNTAKAAMQAELKPVARDTANPHTRSRYASQGDIIESCAPTWGKHGFAVDFDVREAGDRITTVGYLRHAGGHVQEFHTYATPADTSGSQGKSNKTLIQGQQSTVTYQQRNLLMRMIGVATVDDPSDDDGAGVRPAPPPPPPPEPEPEPDDDFARLRRGDPAILDKLIEDIDRQPSSASLERLVDQVRQPVNPAPKHVQDAVGRALRVARERLAEAVPEGFSHPLMDAYGGSDGVLLGLNDWVMMFLGLWDAAAKHPADQTALLEHNADALAAARNAGAAGELADVVPREPDQGVEAWARTQLDALAALHGPEGFETLQDMIRTVTSRMRELQRSHPDAHKRLKHAYEAAYAALKPAEDERHG